jgi:GNAT superfamily N-acetyltransferase
VLIEQRSFDDSELTALVVDQQVELRRLDGGLEGQPTNVDPAARYLVAVLGGDAVACGAIRALDIDTAELMRMYVHPAYRGRGIARRVLAALEDLAAARGHSTLRLEAGVHSAEAIALYLSAGYRPIARFGHYQRNPLSRCFEKRLAEGGADAQSAVRLVRCDYDDPMVTMLVAEAIDELAGRYDGDEAGRSPVDPQARFVVACVAGKAAGCGGIQLLDDQTAELKRMYVRPEHRGTGLARRMLTALEDLAVGAHYPLIRLETGTGQPEAIALYESAGYRAIPAYGPYVHNAHSRCYEKLLITADSAGTP